MRFKNCPHCQALNQVPKDLLVEGGPVQETEVTCSVPGGCDKKFFARRNRLEVHGVLFSEHRDAKPETVKVDTRRPTMQPQFRAAQAT